MSSFGTKLSNYGLWVLLGIFIIFQVLILLAVSKKPSTETIIEKAQVIESQIIIEEKAPEPAKISANKVKPCVTQLNPRVRAKVFDTAVNAGHSRAIKILQQSLNKFSTTKPKLSVDGVIGPKTRLASCNVDPGKLLTTYANQQADFYRGIVARKPNQQKFLKGWLRRAAWIPPVDFDDCGELE